MGRERLNKRNRLVLAGTADRPITVETPEGNPPGFIAGDLVSGSSIIASHVVFRRIGSAITGKRGAPAMFLVLNSSDDDLWLRQCTFNECGRIHGEFIGVGATAEIDGCTFAHTAGDTAIELIGTGEGSHVIRDNISDAAFRVECSQILLQDNVLVGEWAAVTMSGQERRRQSPSPATTFTAPPPATRAGTPSNATRRKRPSPTTSCSAGRTSSSRPRGQSSATC